MPSEKQRREAERRRQARQLQHRRARAARRRRINVIVSIIGALVVIAAIVVFAVATGNDNEQPAAKSSTPTPTPSPSTSASSASPVAAYPCTWTPGGTAARKVSVPPTTKPARSGAVDVAITTTRGPMTFRLNRAAAPCAVESFVSLAQQRYFDNTACHRLTSTATLHVLQCGDPSGTGRGGPGYSFADELTGKEKYTRGVLAMANGGPNTNGSQFFIVYGATTLPASYTIFGTVPNGLAVVDKVAAAGSRPATDGKPKLPISITKATVAGRA
ncbi:MAG TPA: peptidylprolyl isomerase [Jatrophihabitans sp.]|nr:peptidylprolyl isomerase [Jatrophihabitans sp.]